MNKPGTVLILTSHFPPNIGGVETHLNDLVKALMSRRWQVVVSTYKPLARNISTPTIEKRGRLKIYRLPWLGLNLVHKFTPYPLIEFLYLFPGLFFTTGWVLLRNKKIQVIHAQGLVPAVVALIWGKVVHKKTIASTHNLYFFPKKGFYRLFSKYIFSGIDTVLTLSNQSADEIAELGIRREKIKPFRYWLDLKLFKPMNKNKAKAFIGYPKEFIVCFVGRMIETKGVGVLLNVAQHLKVKNIKYLFGGLGPLSATTLEKSKRNPSIVYLGPLQSQQVRVYMNAADIVVVPSLVDEGYGRVAMEAIASGAYVLAAKRGGLSEVVDPSVGRLIEPTTKDYLKWLRYLSQNKDEILKKTKITREYALKNFSEKNVEAIIKEYYR